MSLPIGKKAILPRLFCLSMVLLPNLGFAMGPDSSSRTVRKNANAMTPEEIDLFERGFQAYGDGGDPELSDYDQMPYVYDELYK